MLFHKATTSPNAHDNLPRLSNAKPPAAWIRTFAKTSGRKAGRNIGRCFVVLAALDGLPYFRSLR